MAISSIKKAASNLSRARKSIGTSGAAPKAVTSAYVDPSQVYGDKGQNFDAKVLSGTKFGDLVLDGSEFVSGGKELTISGEEAFAKGYENLPYKATNLNLTINGQTYTFHPKNILEKGFVANGQQFYNPSVLANLDKAYEQGQAVNLKDVGWYDDFLKKNDLSTEGILLPAGELNFKIAGGNGYKVAPIGNLTEDGRVKLNEITGIGKVGDQYVYTTDVTKVDATDASGYYDQSGQGRAEWTKERGGLLGSASRAVAKVPFLPEIAGAATQNPYVYATLKGLQGGATGQDPLKVGLKAGATILAADLASNLLKGTPVGVEGGFPADYNVEPYGPGGITPDTVLPPLPPVTPPTVPSAFDTAIDTAISGRVGEGAFGQVGTGGFGTAIPSAESVATNLRNAGFSAGTADALAGVNLAGVGSATTAGLPISLSDAFRGARAASSINNLLNPPSAGEGGVDQGGAQPTMAGVDYSGLYNLLAQRSPTGGLLGTQYQPQPLNLASLLG